MTVTKTFLRNETVVVSKEFTWSMGHRLPYQKLLPGYEAKCRMLHGHNYKLVVYIELRNAGSTINYDTSMVLDFTLLKPIKDFIDRYLDHKFMLPVDDLLVRLIVNEAFRQLDKLYAQAFRTDKKEPATYTIASYGELRELFDTQDFDLVSLEVSDTGMRKHLQKPVSKFDDLVALKDLVSSFVLLRPGINPSAEFMSVFFAKYSETLIFDIYSKWSNDFYATITIPKLEVYETDKAKATYLAPIELENF